MFFTLFKKWRLPLSLLALILLVIALGTWNERREEAKTPPANAVVSAEPTYTRPVPSSASPSSVTPSLPEPQRFQIQASDVNLRAQPTTTAEILARARSQSVYTLTGQVRHVKARDWLELFLPDGRKAWVSADLGQIWSPGAASGPPVKPSGTVAQKALPQSQDEPLNLRRGSDWLQAGMAERQQTSEAFLLMIFKGQPERATVQNRRILEACISASVREKDLQKMKVYEIAAACALALDWR